MRIKNSIVNISAGIGNQVLITLLSFISRSVFIGSLGATYLGINGLFTNILGMLSLAESGIGSSIVYSLYKPVAENDEEKIIVLLRLYKNAFRVIGLIIFILGLSLMPFLKYLMKGSTIENINIIYLIFLINTTSQYLFTYKISFLNVCQKKYIVTGIYSISSVIIITLKICILYFTENYILYLSVDSITTIATSIILSKIVDKMYPFIKNKTNKKLDSMTKNNIVKNVKALIIHNIGGYCVFGTDNMIISSFISITAVGLYSNYSMLINLCRSFIDQIFNNINASVGNLVAKESNDKIYSVFRVTMFLNFWIYSFFCIILYVTIQPFITLWIGEEYLMSNSIVIILIVNFYVSGMRKSISMVKSTSGIFHEDRFAPLVEAFINLIVSIILVKYIGIAGVFLGTLISTLSVPFWLAPNLVYKKVFNRNVGDYFKQYVYYMLIAFIAFITTNFICNCISVDGILGLVLRGIICILVPNLLYVLVFYKNNEFKYLLNIAIAIKKKLLGKNNIAINN